MQNTHSIVDVPGIQVGHAQDDQAMTGCTVILCDEGSTGGVDQRGGAPGTRETDALRPMHLVSEVHAIVLAGGSAYGLDAASGVMQYLEERGVGVDTGPARVPIVPAAILFDLGLGDPHVRPNARMGYQACLNASNTQCAQGNVGAGAGATAGKILGIHRATKTGIGSASLEIGNGIIVGAIVAVNAFGDVIDPESGKIIAGVRAEEIDSTPAFLDTLQLMRQFAGRSNLSFSSKNNTLVGVVATNATFDKQEANKVAQMAHNGIAQTIRPAHTMFDGDTLFCVATNKVKVDINVVGAFASVVVAQAIVQAVKSSSPAGGLPSYQSLHP